MNALTAAALGLAIVLVLLYVKLKWKSLDFKFPEPTMKAPSSQVFHHLCPHHNVVQRYELEEKDSLDDHLDVLTRKLADKEGRLRVSKSKIRETQNEIENLHAIDIDVRTRYREIMESLRSDLLNNENDCKKLQEQIEWVSQRRAELKAEVNRGQLLFGEAAADLANSLAELQRARTPEQRVTDKPRISYSPSLRCRREQTLPRASPLPYSTDVTSNHMYNVNTNTSNSYQGILME